MKKKGKMAACLILLVLLLAVLVVLTKKNSTADADSSSSDSGADAEKVVDFSKDDVTALSFQINGETVSFTKTAGDDDTDIWTYDQEDGFPSNISRPSGQLLLKLPFLFFCGHSGRMANPKRTKHRPDKVLSIYRFYD